LVAIHGESWAEADLLTVLEQGHQLLLCPGPTDAAMETLMTRSVHISPVPTHEGIIEYNITQHILAYTVSHFHQPKKFSRSKINIFFSYYSLINSTISYLMTCFINSL